AHQVVANADGEVDEFALVIHALAADVFVTVVLGPGLLRFLKLAGDSMAAEIGQDPSQPVIEHARLELEPHPKTNGPLIEASQEGQDVVAAHETALEKIHLALGAEH